MSDVYADLEAGADALADLVHAHAGALPLPSARAVAAHLAELTVVARRVVLAVEGTGTGTAPRITDAGLLGDAVLAWRSEHRKAVELLATAAGDVPWPGGPLRPSLLAAALLTVLFARGQDIADVLGARLPRDDAIGHVAYYGVRTSGDVYAGHGGPPAGLLRFELTAPSGTLWEFGPADAVDRISGRAEDFCLLFTGRRPAAGLAVEATGPRARRWLELVQQHRNPLWTSESD
jgi:uncharacterized protein (TIGR03084 family)